MSLILYKEIMIPVDYGKILAEEINNTYSLLINDM